MKALSIKQPWADLIIRGLKDVENRTWGTNYRGPLLIHAGKNLMPGQAIANFYGPNHEWELGGIVGIVDLVDCVTNSKSPWATQEDGVFHWVVANARRLDFFPLTGKLNLFEVTWPPSDDDLRRAAGKKHARDEKPATQADAMNRASRLRAIEFVARALPTSRLRSVVEAMDDPALPASDADAVAEFTKRYLGLLHTVLHQLTVDEIGAMTRSLGTTPKKTLAPAVIALENVIATHEEDYADEPDEQDDADDFEDAELLAETGITVEDGWLLYLDESGALCKARLPADGLTDDFDFDDLTDVAVLKPAAIVREPGYIFFVDTEGRIFRKPHDADEDGDDDGDGDSDGGDGGSTFEVVDEDDDDDDEEDSNSPRVTRPRGPAPKGTSGTSDIDDVHVDDVMAAVRQAARNQGAVERVDLLRAVARELGYQRMGNRIEDALRGHLRAAIRRRVIVADGKLVRADTGKLEDYSLDELREALIALLRKGQQVDRETATRALVHSLGFSRVTDNVRETMKSVYNSAIRQGLLDYDGPENIWRK